MDAAPSKPDRRHRPDVPLTPAQRELCEEFVRKYPDPIALLFTRYPGTYRWAMACRLDKDEIRQLGWLGVIHAAKKFIPGTVSKGRVVQFATYALPWIRNAVMRPMVDGRRQKRTPANGATVGRLPTPGLTADPNAVTPDHDLDALETSERLAEALMRLPDRDRKIVTRRHGCHAADGKAETLDALAADLGITSERVRQIQDVAVRSLRRDLGAA